MELYQYDKAIEQYIDPDTGEVLEGIAYNVEALKASAVKIKISSDKQSLIKSEIDRLNDLLKNEQRKEFNLKRFGVMVLEHMGEKTVDFGTFSVSYRNNPGRLELDPDADVSKYQYTEIVETTKTDKAAIKADLEAGNQIKGAQIIKEKSLQIK